MQHRPLIDKQLSNARKQLDEARLAGEMGAFKGIDSPQFKQQMEEMQRQITDAAAKIDTPEFRKQLDDAAKAASEAGLRLELTPNLPDELRLPGRIDLDRRMEDVNRQIAELTARLGNLGPLVNLRDPKFELLMEDAQRRAAAAAAQFDTPEFKRQMEEMNKRIQSGELQRRLNAAERALRETEKQLEQSDGK